MKITQNKLIKVKQKNVNKIQRNKIKMVNKKI